jgi:hypothetical protein
VHVLASHFADTGSLVVWAMEQEVQQDVQDGQTDAFLETKQFAFAGRNMSDTIICPSLNSAFSAQMHCPGALLADFTTFFSVSRPCIGETFTRL